jgi:hypothetical protein
LYPGDDDKYLQAAKEVNIFAHMTMQIHQEQPGLPSSNYSAGAAVIFAAGTPATTESIFRALSR